MNAWQHWLRTQAASRTESVARRRGWASALKSPESESTASLSVSAGTTLRLGGPGTQMVGRILWDEFFSKTNWPRAAALAFVMLVVVVIPIMLMQRAQNAVVTRPRLKWTIQKITR